jgi:hypothetical protein
MITPELTRPMKSTTSMTPRLGTTPGSSTTELSLVVTGRSVRIAFGSDTPGSWSLDGIAVALVRGGPSDPLAADLGTGLVQDCVGTGLVGGTGEIGARATTTRGGGVAVGRSDGVGKPGLGVGIALGD